MMEPMTSPETIAVIIPAKDEAGAIRQVLARIPRQIDGMDVSVIVVDDGSKDGTGTIARDCRVYVLRHVTNLGAPASSSPWMPTGNMTRRKLSTSCAA